MCSSWRIYSLCALPSLRSDFKPLWTVATWRCADVPSSKISAPHAAAHPSPDQRPVAVETLLSVLCQIWTRQSESSCTWLFKSSVADELRKRWRLHLWSWPFFLKIYFQTRSLSEIFHVPFDCQYDFLAKTECLFLASFLSDDIFLSFDSHSPTISHLLLLLFIK